MPLAHTFKRIVRSWKLFIALLLGVLLAATFFSGTNVGADTAAKQALDQQLAKVPVDLVVGTGHYSVISDASRKTGLMSMDNITEVRNDILQVEDVVDAEAISRSSGSVSFPGNGETVHFSLVGISEDSHVFNGLTAVNGTQSLEENETLVWLDSQHAASLDLGSILQIDIDVSLYSPRSWNANKVTLTLNLTVMGFVELSDQALSIVTGSYYSSGTVRVTTVPKPYGQDILIVSLEKTFGKMLDAIYALEPSYSPVSTDIAIYLDRPKLISVWDIPGSINNIKAAKFQINQKIAEYGLQATDHVTNALAPFQFIVIAMRFMFVIVSLPVFFVAWYMGATVSDVSFNLRRREIGLLLTKGFSRGQLLRMFLTEALLIGLVAGLIGLVLSLTLSPFFIRAAGGQFTGVPVFGPDTVIFTLIFSVGITLLSVYRPARKASNLSTVDALREYMYMEEVKPYRRRGPLIALALGTYKLVILVLGLNLIAEFSRVAFRGANFLLVLLLLVAVFLDIILTFIGPLLFFWGFTKIFIHGSLKFQALTTRALRFLGDLGTLATKNVQRNPARAASLAFLIALIVGYAVQVTGTLASEEDFTIRQIYYSVGADLSIQLTSPSNASVVLLWIQNMSDVASATLEYSIQGSLTYAEYGGMQLKAVNPQSWLATAYYEDTWFSGTDVKTAFEALASDNNTIILERGYAKTLKLNVGETVNVNFGESLRQLKIVGFFGPEPQETGLETAGMPAYYPQFWSYISHELFHELNEDTRTSARILARLRGGVDGETVAEQIVQETDISSVDSVAKRLRERTSNVLVTGSLNLLRLGVVFVVLAASVGTALVTLVSLKERDKEASLMGVRGLSLRQLVAVLLTENLTVVAFAVFLGSVVGLIIVRGTVAASNVTASTYSLVTRRILFPPEVSLTLLLSFVLIFASNIIPVIVISKMYLSNLERTVRQV